VRLRSTTARRLVALTQTRAANAFALVVVEEERGEEEAMVMV
jgi:hypothetical protein